MATPTVGKKQRSIQDFMRPPGSTTPLKAAKEKSLSQSVAKSPFKSVKEPQSPGLRENVNQTIQGRASPLLVRTSRSTVSSSSQTSCRRQVVTPLKQVAPRPSGGPLQPVRISSTDFFSHEDMEVMTCSQNSSVCAEDLLESSSLVMESPMKFPVSGVLHKTPVASSARKRAVIDKMLSHSSQKACRQLSLEIGEDSQLGLQSSDAPKTQKAKKMTLRDTVPGLRIFTPESGLTKYAYGQLHLERNFGFTGRRRLLEAGLEIDAVNKLMVDPRFLASLCLPLTGETLVIDKQGDFVSVVEFLFYSTMVYHENDKIREYLDKSLFSLLRQYSGYKWRLTSVHVAMCWLNWGAPSTIVLNTDVIRKIYHGKPLPNLKAHRFKPMEKRAVYPLHLFVRGLKLIKDILTVGRWDFSSPQELMSLTWLLCVAGQHVDIVKDHIASMMITDILDIIFCKAPKQQISSRSFIQKLAQLLSLDFRPLHTTPSTLNWKSHHLPRHFRILGLNHPQNLLHLISLFPRSDFGSRLLSMVGYLNIQLMLSVASFDLPDRVFVKDLCKLMAEFPTTWDPKHGPLVAPILAAWHIVDIILLTKCYILPRKGESAAKWQKSRGFFRFGTKGYAEFKKLTEMLDDFHRSLPKDDPLNLDPVILRRCLISIHRRWQNETHRLENINKLMTNVQEDMKRQQIDKHNGSASAEDDHPVNDKAQHLDAKRVESPIDDHNHVPDSGSPEPVERPFQSFSKILSDSKSFNQSLEKPQNEDAVDIFVRPI